MASGTEVLVPAPVIYEALTGNVERNARIGRVLNACRVVPLDKLLARSAGALRSPRPRSGAVNAMVMACADAVPFSIVITGDPGEMLYLAAQRGRTIVIGY
jgi:predicted nucleic acid-binding protein